MNTPPIYSEYLGFAACGCMAMPLCSCPARTRSPQYKRQNEAHGVLGGEHANCECWNRTTDSNESDGLGSASRAPSETSSSPANNPPPPVAVKTEPQTLSIGRDHSHGQGQRGLVLALRNRRVEVVAGGAAAVVPLTAEDLELRNSHSDATQDSSAPFPQTEIQRLYSVIRPATGLVWLEASPHSSLESLHVSLAESRFSEASAASNLSSHSGEQEALFAAVGSWCDDEPSFRHPEVVIDP